MNDYDRQPPNDLTAERSVISHVLQAEEILRSCLEILTPVDFYRPAHGDVWEVCTKLHAEGIEVDHITVNRALQDAGNVHAMKALLDAVGTPLSGTSPVQHARIVADRSRLRQLAQFGQQLVQRAHQPGESDAEGLIAWAADQSRTLRDSGVMIDEDLTIKTLDELLATPISHDWVIEGLLERGDRLLLTGAEGLGKSFLSRQIGMCAAAGLHPFLQTDQAPQKVLVIDAENSDKVNVRAYAWLQRAISGMSRSVGNRWVIDSYPYGMNIMDPRQGNKLMRTVEAQQPDLIIVGPLYKIHDLDDEKAGEALKIQHYLDRVRSVCGSAMIMELHSGHGGGAHGRDLRPAGSSVWRRWPEFGFGLALATGDFDEEHAMRERLVDVKPWRGPRDERDWPVRLRGSKAWPFIPANIEDPHDNHRGW
ncbi:MAG: AAA family ATPase [Actinobacteria bacterium]|nr:AAA family ATPase [Actinomycetota bacterium]